MEKTHEEREIEIEGVREREQRTAILFHSALQKIEYTIIV